VAKENANRLYPGLGAVEVASSYVYDIYNSLQLSATKRTDKGLTLLLSTFGNIGRNSLRGPAYADVDASIFKNFRFTERFRLQFRAEAFNLQNRANFQNPTATVSSATYGRITAAYDPRVLQFGLKLLF
jgi:hypothetical protein